MNKVDTKILREKLIAQREELTEKARNKYMEAKQALLNNTDCSKTEELLRNYEIADYRFGMIKDDFDDDIINARIKAAELFNKMAMELSNEFNDEEYEVEVDTENFTITFDWYGSTLSFPVKMIANMYKLHSGMFSFDSSFSRHEAFTEDNYALHIGLSGDCGIKIDFGKLDEIRICY